MNNDWQNKVDDSEEIKENEGGIPGWFNILFIGGIIVGISYGILYHFVFNHSQKIEYQNEVKAYAQLENNKVVELTPEGKNPLRNDPVAISSGKLIFNSFCSACHKIDATGLIGPSLVDKEWLHGNREKEIFQVVSNGVDEKKLKQNPPKGLMPAHNQSLGSKKILQVMAYLVSLGSKIE